MEHLTSHASHAVDPERAAHELDVAIEGTSPFVTAVEEIAAELDAMFPPPTDKEVEAFKRHILSRPHTPEWDLVIRRIEAGELTWREIASGEVDTDRDVDAAMRSIQKVEVSALKMNTYEATEAAVPAEEVRPPRRAHFDDDDDYFGGFTPRA